MKQPPDGWRRLTIGSLCNLINGRAFKPTDWSKKGLPIVRIQNLNNASAPFNRYDGEVRDRFLVDSGDLLFAWSGTPGTSFGAHIWDRGRAVLNQHIFKVVFDNEALNKEFFRLAINQKLDELIDKAHGGVGLRHVTKGKFEETEVLLPPYEKQGRIVAKLDRLLERSRRAREELARVSQLVERYKQAILKAAFRGEITTAWRKGNALPRTTPPPIKGAVRQSPRREGGRDGRELSEPVKPKTWKTVDINAVGEVILGRQRSPENHNGPKMRPYVRAANITWGGWEFSDIKKMNFDARDFEKFKLEVGDVLINEGSGSATEVGKPAIWKGEIKDCCFQNTLIAVRPHAVTSEYLYFVILNAARSGALVDETRGVNIHHIGRAGLAQFVIPVPPRDEQEEIVRRIKDAFSRIERLSEQASQAAELVTRLDEATLAAAFRGKLVASGND